MLLIWTQKHQIILILFLLYVASLDLVIFSEYMVHLILSLKLHLELFSNKCFIFTILLNFLSTKAAFCCCTKVRGQNGFFLSILHLIMEFCLIKGHKKVYTCILEILALFRWKWSIFSSDRIWPFWSQVAFFIAISPLAFCIHASSSKDFVAWLKSIWFFFSFSIWKCVYDLSPRPRHWIWLLKTHTA